jgi:hypothetical protein
MTERPRLRKRSLAADTATAGRAADEIDIACCATVAYSSEDLAHPVENLLDGQSGPGGTRWVSARPDTAEHIVVEFDQPQAISRLIYEVEETRRERNQEVRVEASDDSMRAPNSRRRSSIFPRAQSAGTSVGNDLLHRNRCWRARSSARLGARRADPQDPSCRPGGCQWRQPGVIPGKATSATKYCARSRRPNVVPAAQHSASA